MLGRPSALDVCCFLLFFNNNLSIMTKRSLSLAEAIRLRTQLQPLIGQPIDEEIIGNGKIECVAISPFEEARQWQFVQFYKMSNDAENALKFYSGHEFDVILISRPVLKKRTLHYKSFSDYYGLQQALQ